MQLNNICVYCGSSSGADPAFMQGARELADVMADANIGLVYGGASIGVMGEIADRVLQKGGRVCGVIPKALENLEIAHQGLTELLIVEDMHQRKAAMADRSDGFIALPGGLGTLEELFEALTWAQLGMQLKPVGVLNVNSFYERMFDFMDWQVEQGFVRQAHRELLLSSASPAALVDKLSSYVPDTTPKVLAELRV